MPTLDPNNLSTQMGRWDIEIDNEGRELVIRVSEASGLRLEVRDKSGSNIPKTAVIAVAIDEG